MPDLDQMVTAIMRMAEQSQQNKQNQLTAAGFDPFGSQGAKYNAEREFNLRKKEVDDKAAYNLGLLKNQDNSISMQRDANNLAHPMSLLSGQEQRIHLADDIKQKRALELGAVRAQTAQSLYHEGAGQHYSGSGALSQVKADTQRALLHVMDRLTPQEQMAALLDKDPVMATTKVPNSSVAVPEANLSYAQPYTDETVKVTPKEQELISGSTNSVASPALGVNNIRRKSIWLTP